MEEENITTVTLQRRDSSLGLNIKGGKDKPNTQNDDGIFITQIKNDSAKKAGIQEGDKVLEINGKSVDGLNHDEVITLFARAGKEVTLRIWKDAENILQERFLQQVKENGASEAENQTTGSESETSGQDDKTTPGKRVPVSGEGYDNSIPNDDINHSSNPDSSDAEDVAQESAENLFRKLAAGNRIRHRVIDDNNLPPTVSVLHGNEGQKVYLIGTAHFSKDSCDDVRTVITQAQPDVVMIELCRGRSDLLVNDEEMLSKLAGDVSFGKVMRQIRQKGVVSGLMTFLLLHMSAHITKQLGMAPGGEFRAAYQEARKIPGCKVMFGDRAVEVTLQRAFATLSVFRKIKFACQILKDLGPIKPEDIEKLKEKDMLEQALGEMMQEFPQMTDVFLTERDTYLARSLQLAASNEIATENGIEPTVVVGVVGLGHAGGMKENFHREIPFSEMDKLMEVPKPSVMGRVVKWCIRLSLISAFGYGIYRFTYGIGVPVFQKIISILNFTWNKSIGSEEL